MVPFGGSTSDQILKSDMLTCGRRLKPSTTAVRSSTCSRSSRYFLGPNSGWTSPPQVPAAETQVLSPRASDGFTCSHPCNAFLPAVMRHNDDVDMRRSDCGK